MEHRFTPWNTMFLKNTANERILLYPNINKFNARHD
jgi:hypothetical protein